MSDNDFDRVETEKKLSKLAKKFDEPLVEELNNMSEADLKARIVSCQMNLEESNAAKARDEKLAEVAEELKELRAPYRETISHQRKVLTYATLRLRMMEL